MERRGNLQRFSSERIEMSFNILDLWLVRLRWFVGHIEVFFTRESHDEKLFLISGLSQKFPGEAEHIVEKFLCEIENHWEKLREEHEANRPPLPVVAKEAAGNKQQSFKSSEKPKSTATPSEARDAAGNQKTGQQTSSGVPKSAQKPENSKKPEVPKPLTPKSTSNEPNSAKSGNPKNPPTMKSVVPEKLSNLLVSQMTEETIEKRMTEEMLKNQEKEKQLERMLERESEKTEMLERELKKLKDTMTANHRTTGVRGDQMKEELSEKDRIIEELRKQLAAFNKNVTPKTSASSSKNKE